MRQILLIIGIYLFCSCELLQAKEPLTLKVMTYNIRFGELATLEQLAEFINSENPDLVALQEVDWMTMRDRAPHQHHKDFITELGYRTGMFSLYGKTIPHANGLYGIGILTRKPYVNVKKVILPKAANVTEYRALLMAEIEITPNDTIIFASTHLDYSSPQAKMDQVKAIIKEVSTVVYPVLIGGDFNAHPNTPEMGMFSDWAMCCNSLPTVPAKTPKSKIDYLFGYPKPVWNVLSSATIQTELSDHLPIVSEIEFISNRK